MGEEGLSEADRRYLGFGERFESEFVNQDGPRTLEESMSIGWRLLALLPLEELSRLSDEQIERYVHAEAA